MKVISNSLIDIYGELAQATSWITAKDLAETTDLSRATINRCLNYLIEEGLVVYEDVRPAWLYKLMPKPKNPKLLARLRVRVALEQKCTLTTDSCDNDKIFTFFNASF